MYNLIFLLIPFLFCYSVYSVPIKEYRVVIDPGHGGTKQVPFEVYGDKYDVVTEKYLENYKSGASHKSRTEMEIVLELAKEVQNILELTQTQMGFKKFKSFIKLFSRTNPPWVKINSSLTRKDNAIDRRFREKDDKNADYRMYDYVDFATGKRKLGRISKINQEKPYLLVSLHVNSMGDKNTGMSVVLSPSYRTFHLLRNISLKTSLESEFNRSNWRDWIRFQPQWNTLQNAIADTWIYFHGYWPNKSFAAFDFRKFEGYRQNMVTWKYLDKSDWVKKIGKKGPYSKTLEDFEPTGVFWEREMSRYETMRREDGPEGFGGDNYFAGMELLRYVQYGLRTEEAIDSISRYSEPGPILKPYISTYSLPIYINAICAYLEMGDIAIDRDIYYLTAKRKKVAISLAVGIYSLLQGLEVKNIETKYIPTGKKIDFSKYITKDGEIYFNEVIE